MRDFLGSMNATEPRAANFVEWGIRSVGSLVMGAEGRKEDNKVYQLQRQCFKSGTASNILN